MFATAGANMGQRPFDDTAGDATEDALHFQLSSDGVHEIYIFIHITHSHIYVYIYIFIYFLNIYIYKRDDK